MSEHLSDLPATRAWEAYWAKWRSRQDLPVFIARRADAMHDELLARVAELEAELEECRNDDLAYDRRKRREAEAERDALRTVLTPSQRKRFDAQWQPREEGER